MMQVKYRSFTAHYESRSTLSAHTEWTSAIDTVFDGTYRHILGAANEKAKQRRHSD
jgi:hypothetical protein